MATTSSKSLWRRFMDWSTRLTRAPYTNQIPELELFPDQESREQALKEIERNMMPRSLLGLLQFLAAVCLFIALPVVVGFGVMFYVVPPMGRLNSWGAMLITLVGYTIIVFLAIRRDMPKALRERLIAKGIPVCKHCGYGLRGTPSETTRCPECGRALSVEVRLLMPHSSQSSLKPSASSGSSASRTGDSSSLLP